MSAGQSLALLRGMLPGVTAAEVSEAFTRNFDPGQVVFIAELPASDGVPTEAELLALGRAAVEVTRTRWRRSRGRRRSTTLPKAAPCRESGARASGVTSMWLDMACAPTTGSWTSARMRRASRSRSPATIQETAADRGLTSGAARLGARRRAPVEHGDPRPDTGAKVRVRSGRRATRDVTVSGDPAELERGLQIGTLSPTRSSRRLRSSSGRTGTAADRRRKSADAGLARSVPTRSIPRTRRGPSR